MPITTEEKTRPRALDGVFSTRAELALHGVYEISKLLALPVRIETTLSNVLTLLSSFLEMRHGLIALLDEHGEPDIVVGMGWEEAISSGCPSARSARSSRPGCR